MMLEKIGRIWVSSAKSRLRKRIDLAGYREPPLQSFGIMTMLLTVLGIAWAFYLVFGLIGVGTYGLYTILVLVFFAALSLAALFFAGYVLLRVYFEVAIYQRTMSIEKNLSSYLREFSTNLRAGEEFVDALERATSPVLGPLDTDIKRMVIEIRGGEKVADVLASYANRYDSYIIDETFSVIREAYLGGGGLAPILDRIADHLDVIDQLKKEAIASISNYIIFMSVVAVVISPILFSLAYSLVDLLQVLLRRVATSGGSTQVLPAFVTQFNVNLQDFITFSRIAIAFIAGSAAAIIGIVRSGNLRGAPALIVLYIAASLIIYQISLALFSTFFSGLFVI